MAVPAPTRSARACNQKLETLYCTTVLSRSKKLLRYSLPAKILYYAVAVTVPFLTHFEILEPLRDFPHPVLLLVLSSRSRV